jgi:hypothetical protein
MARGFRVTRPVTSTFDWSASAPPIVLTRLIATREDRLEPISYWMRSRLRRHQQQLGAESAEAGRRPHGMGSPRGALSQSTVGLPPDISFKVQDKFIRDLLNEAPAETRVFMVGDPAKALLRARPPAPSQGDRQTYFLR